MAEIDTKKEFESTLDEGDKVLIDYYASWCGPCRQMEPVVEELSSDLNIQKLNVDELPSVAQDQGVMALPTLVLYENGEEVARETGAQSKSNIQELYNQE